MKKILVLLFFVLAPAIVHAQDAAFKEDVQKLMDAIGVPERIAATRQHESLWVSPAEEKEHMAKVEATIPGFLQNVENYFLKKYTHEEVKELLAFYETPLGEKVTANMASLITAVDTAESEWGDTFMEILFAYRKDREK